MVGAERRHQQSHSPRAGPECHRDLGVGSTSLRATPGAQILCEHALACSGIRAWTADSANIHPFSASAVHDSRGEAAIPEQLERVCADGKARASISKQQIQMALPTVSLQTIFSRGQKHPSRHSRLSSCGDDLCLTNT